MISTQHLNIWTMFKQYRSRSHDLEHFSGISIKDVLGGKSYFLPQLTYYTLYFTTVRMIALELT